MKTRLCGLVLLMLAALPSTLRAQFIFTTNGGNITIVQYTGAGGAVTIPNSTNGHPVTTIGSAAFFQVTGLTSLVIGTNVTTLADNAIFQCPNLTSVAFPLSVTNIGQGPVIDCLALTTMTLGSSNQFYTVTNGSLFNKSQTSLIQNPGGVGGTYNLSALVTNIGEAFIGNTLTSIVANAANTVFNSTNGVLCDKFHSVLYAYPGSLPGPYTVPATIVVINGATFEFSTGVTSVTIGTNVTVIGDSAFYDCSSLTGITVNSTNAFYATTNGVLFDKHMTTLIQYPSGLAGTYFVPTTVTNISNGAFGDAFGLTSVVISDNVKSLGFETFYSCQNLASVTLGSQVGYIGQQAFNHCISLTDLVIPNSVTNIDALAFFVCSGLRSVTFGTGVKSLGFEAFAGCSSLTNACFEGNQPVNGGSVFFFDNALASILFVSGTTGWGASYDGKPTAVCLACSMNQPVLSIIPSTTNVVLAWPTSSTGFTLQSTTNLGVKPVVWGTVVPAPAVIGGFNAVTNSLVGPQKFYRLRNP